MNPTVAAHTPSARDMQPLDALLFRGDASARTRSTIVAACLLEQAPAHERVQELFERASRIEPRLRQKVVAPTLSLLLPSWIVDPDFDLAQHLHFMRLKRALTPQALLDLVQAAVTERLDPSRPLWSAQLVEGKGDRRAALVIRMSHAVTDGVGVQRLFGHLFRTDAAVAHGPMPPLPVPEDVTPEELTRQALGRSPVALARYATEFGRGVAGMAAMLAADPSAALGAAREYAASVGRMARAQGAPAAALVQRSARRRVAAFDLPLAAMQRAGTAAHASINDVYLCGIAGALHAYFDAIGQPAATVPLALPVNLRSGAETGAGNYFGAIGLALPVGRAAPRERIALIRAQVRAGRAEPALGLPQAVAPWLARFPAPVTAELARRMPLPDLQASNVAGPALPLFLAGARVLKLWPFGPVPGIAAMFTLQSLAGTAHIGINFDPAAISDADCFAASIQRGFREVLALGGAPVARLPRPLLSRESGS